MAFDRTISIDALLTMTADNYYKSGVVFDAVCKSNPTFAALQKKGFRMEETGGGQIQVNLMYGKNETVKPYSRYGLIDTAPQDGFRPAFYDWCQYSGTVAIDGLSEFQNSGAPRIQKLMREKVKQLTMSFSEQMNEDLWDVETNTTATKDDGLAIIPIPHYANSAPSSTTIDPGGIDTGLSYWQNQITDSGTSGSADFIPFGKEMRNTYNDCSKGSGGAPDLLIASQDVFEFYELIMDQKVRYEMDDKASMGFEAIKFKGARMFWDEHVPDPVGPYNWDHASYAPTTQGAMYYLNSKNLDLVVGKGRDFAPLGFQRPANQDARVGTWVFYGQLVCNNRRKLGVHFDITSTSAT